MCPKLYYALGFLFFFSYYYKMENKTSKFKYMKLLVTFMFTFYLKLEEKKRSSELPGIRDSHVIAIVRFFYDWARNVSF